MTKSTMSLTEQSARVKEIVEDALENQELSNQDVVAVLHNLLNVVESDQEHIVRGMDLPAAYRAAGLQLLSFYPRLVELRYPHVAVKYVTELQGEHIRFIVEVDAEYRRRLETLLEHYSQLLLKEASPDIVAKDDRQRMELKKVLDLSALELSLGNEMAALEWAATSEQIDSLAAEVETLHMRVGRGLGGMRELRHIVASLLAGNQEVVNKALAVLRDKLHVAMTVEDENEVKEALLAVREHAPDSFEEIRRVINQGSASGAAGDMLYSWLASLSSVLPK